MVETVESRFAYRVLTSLTSLTILLIMKVQEIGTLEAKTRLSEILSEVERGRHFYITRHGKRVAELVPIKEEKRRPRFGCGKGTFSYVAPDFDAPLDDFKEYME